MCMNERRFCRCGQNSAYLIFRDNLLPPAVLVELYCPECSRGVPLVRESMLADCGWILEYDLDQARSLLEMRGIKGPVTPAFLFDEGYLTWQGFAPQDHAVNAGLHRRLAHLIEQDLTLYLQNLKSQWLEHVAELKAVGWRKAQQA